MDVLDVIKDEHRQVARMLDRAQECDPGDKQLVAITREIEQALSSHVKIEERLFYSRLRDGVTEDEQLVDVYEAYTEHQVADHLLHLLKAGRKPDERFKAELQVLGESVKHHVQEEESTMFAIARKVIDPEERETLGEKWAKARERLDVQPPTVALRTARRPRARAKGSRS